LISNIVKPNLYQDSVALMQIASQLKAIEGLAEASLMMGTPPNKEILAEAVMLTPDGGAAGPNDLIIALSGSEEAVEKAAQEAGRLLQGQEARGTGERREEAPHTLAAGVARLPGANLALISTPGLYAAAEARKALQMGLHTMIFSDNVGIEDERDLKKLAVDRGLLLMGPDCGTAIIGGVPLGFANVVRRGPVGVVGASGTGMQQITVLVDRYGSGISHAIGTGSHDLSQHIGGAMTMLGLRALLNDPQTEVVVLVSKPPHPDVAAKVLEAAASGNKPVVVIFLGAKGGKAPPSGNGKAPALTFAETLEEAAQLAVRLVGSAATLAPRDEGMNPELGTRNPQQKYIRGLFSGGTFCSEAVILLSEALGEVHSNTPLSPDLALPDPHRSIEHTCVDMGADEFTVGRPHPMIDMSARVERIATESRNPEVAVLLLDVVLGYGASSDPAGALAPAIREAIKIAAEGGRQLGVVAHVCGTDTDPQGYDTQCARLAEAGAILAPSNAAAARLAASIIKDEG
jgi:FdrA protein